MNQTCSINRSTLTAVGRRADSPLPATEAMLLQTSLWSVSDHPAGFSSPLQSGPLAQQTPTMLTAANHLRQRILSMSSTTRARSPSSLCLDLLEGGIHKLVEWHTAWSQPELSPGDQSGLKVTGTEVDDRIIKCYGTWSNNTPAPYFHAGAGNQWKQWPLTLLSWHGLIQQQADHSFPVLQQLWRTFPQTIHQVGPMFMEL